jgi:hypothetical protein
MAAGLGFKTFTTGEVLTAADTNGYLMQGVLVFASSAARTAAITSPQEGQYSYLKDTNSTEYYDGAAWIAAPIGDITGVTAGTGISGGGTSGTVTITNSMATEITAKGDLIAGTGSATFDNLAVGTNGQTLVADSAEATGLKWATASSGALTFIKRASFSGVADTGTTFDSIFSSTYKTYLVVVEDCTAVTYSNALQVQFRYAGPTTQTTGYYGNAIQVVYNSATVANTGTTNASQATIASRTGGSPEGQVSEFWVNRVGNTSQIPYLSGMGFVGDTNEFTIFNAKNQTVNTYTGLLFKSSSSNITGTVAIYGLATA